MDASTVLLPRRSICNLVPLPSYLLSASACSHLPLGHRKQHQPMPHNDARPHPLQVQEVRTTHRSSPFPVIFPAQHKVTSCSEGPQPIGVSSVQDHRRHASSGNGGHGPDIREATIQQRHK
ncbi:uncharacterized protein [Lolium perenne]|uniref:uncharacterized protein n=1 Tax=Lolium perenne TaxID=4522 RepID=UPI003A98EC68